MEMLKTMRSTRFWLVGSSATAFGFLFLSFFRSVLFCTTLYVARRK